MTKQICCPLISDLTVAGMALPCVLEKLKDVAFLGQLGESWPRDPDLSQAAELSLSPGQVAVPLSFPFAFPSSRFLKARAQLN